MDVRRLLIDRELIHSAALHDVRGPLTAVQGWAEIDEDRIGPGPLGALTRITAILDSVGEAATPPAATQTFEGIPVRLRAPIDVLQTAIHDLPHARVEVERVGERVAIRISGLSGEELPSGWSLAQVRRWLEEPGPPLAGARLRMAARLVGAVRQDVDPEVGTVTIWMAAG